MGQAAYKKKVEVSVDGSTDWKEVPATAPALSISGDVIDATNTANTTGYRSRILGLNDWSISCDSHYKQGNDALNLIRLAKINRTKLYARYLPDGVVANGFKGEVVVENFNLSGEVGGLEVVAITLQANGALSDAA